MADENIMAGLRRRDKGAFEEFWNRYYHRIYPICAVILGSGPDAVDMTVDILVDFVEKHADKLTTPRALYAFLRQMAVRRSIRLRDKRDKVTAIERDSQVGREDESTPEEEAELNQLMPLLAECLDRMTPKAQATLRMKYSNKISNEEIGRMVGGSKSYIGRVLKTAREALRKCIEKKAADASLSVAGTRRDRMPGAKPSISLHTVDALLAKRPRIDEGECTEIHRMALASVTVEDAALLEWADAHLVECYECRRAALAIQSSAAQPRDAVGRDRRFRQGDGLARKLVPLAAAASISALLSIFWMWNFGPEKRPPSEADLVIKGGGDALYAAVRRGASKFALRPLDTLLTGDELGLFYSTEKEGCLAVFSRDAAGETDLLYPLDGSTSKRVVKGVKVPLSDGARVSDGTGCEWIVAVFSDEPIPLDNIAAAVKAGRVDSTSDSCGLRITVAQARSVRVLPVKRQGEK